MNAPTNGFYIVRDSIQGVSLCDRFADALAESGCIAAASLAAGVPVEIGEQLFRSICRKLGPQAE
jgi:hypothetical protein